MLAQRVSIHKFINFMFAFTAFINLNPYFTWHSGGLLYRMSLVVTFFGFFLIAIAEQSKFSLLNYILVLLCMVTYVALLHSNLERLVKSLILGLVVFAFLLLHAEDKVSSFRYFSILFAISLIPGFVVYVCHLIGINLSWSYLEPLNPLKTQLGHYYRRYHGAVVLVSSYVAPIWPYRFCGMFDEPGVIGTITALLLIGNRFNLKSLYSKILLIGGILSLSFAFFILVILYFVLEFTIHRNFKVGIALVIIVGLLSLSASMNDDSYLKRYIFDRFATPKTGFIVNNRTNQAFDREFEHFSEKGVRTILLGEGLEKRLENPDLLGSSSIKLVIYDSGYIGFFALLFFYAMLALRYRSTHSFIFLIIFYSSMYQRPNVLNLSYVLIFIGAILSVQFSEQRTNSVHLERLRESKVS